MRTFVNRYEKIVVEFYNVVRGESVESIEQIDTETVVFLTATGYRAMLDSLVSKELSKGRSQEEVAIRYGINRATVQRIGRKIGLCK